MNDFGTKAEEFLKNKRIASNFIKTVTQDMVNKTGLTYAGYTLRKHFKHDVIAQAPDTYSIERDGKKHDVLFTALFSKGGDGPFKTLLVEASK